MPQNEEYGGGKYTKFVCSPRERKTILLIIFFIIAKITMVYEKVANKVNTWYSLNQKYREIKICRDSCKFRFSFQIEFPIDIFL